MIKSDTGQRRKRCSIAESVRHGNKKPSSMTRERVIMVIGRGARPVSLGIKRNV